MGFSDVREQDVLDAIATCDEMGQAAFLEHYGFREALRYVLVHDGRQYDSKAIVGVAHEYLAGRALAASEFSGGRATVGNHLERLGFVVQERTGATQLVLQPRGGSRDKGPQNFARTVIKGVALSEHAEAFGPDLPVLEALYRSGTARLWGATPPRRVNDAKARAIRDRRVGDRVLFYAERTFIAEAVILHLFRNPTAAKSVWGMDPDGRTWEHMMALGDARLLDPAHPAPAVVRRVSNRDDLRSLTLVPADEHAALAGLLPQDAQRSTGSASSAPRPLALTPQELLACATSLRQHHLVGRASRHQPLTLLWAIGQLVAGAPRLHSWSRLRREVGAVLAEFDEGVSAAPEFPFWQLQQTRLWEVPELDADPGFTPGAARFAADDPSAGFTDEAFTLLKNVRLRTRTINALRSRYLADVQDQDALLDRLGLASYATASGLEQPDAQAGGPARRRSSTGSVIERKSRLGESVKALHDHRCQLCETQLLTATGFYSEAAHIRGLGAPHDGPDELSNMLCLCANCHIQFDRFALYIDDADVVRHVRDQRELGVLRRHERHTINDEQIRYHRSLCDIPGAQPDATDE